mgnify:CR=1 FL=1
MKSLFLASYMFLRDSVAIPWYYLRYSVYPYLARVVDRLDTFRQDCRDTLRIVRYLRTRDRMNRDDD